MPLGRLSRIADEPFADEKTEWHEIPAGTAVRVDAAGIDEMPFRPVAMEPAKSLISALR